MDLGLGKKIKALADKKKFSVVELADAVGTGERNMYNLFKSNDMYVSQLFKLSQKLGHNYFKEIAATLDKEIGALPEIDVPAAVNEAMPSYGKRKSKIVTIKFEVQYDIANSENLGKFMMFVDSAGDKLGFKLV